MLPLCYSCLSLLATLALTGIGTAADPGIEFFEKKIRPVLVEHCYECHSTNSKKVRGGLLLDSRPAILKGGASGPVLESGHPEKSLLIKAIRFELEDAKMPPNGKLPPAAIADLEAWVKMGAPDPREKATQVKPAQPWSEIYAQRKNWWSLKPVGNPPLPAIPNPAQASGPVDQFIIAKLHEKNLKLASPALPKVLIRRLSLTLTGLPPTPSEITAFENAVAEKGHDVAVRELTNRLLASEHFGERWARHWMDVVRFTETHGNEWNYEVHHAWRYRDYLIRAFNQDLPYDDFIREHIAGDLLVEPRWNKAEQFNESLIGTAFWRFGEVNHDDCTALPTIGYDLADNAIDTMSKAFQATTVACARCHDHKLDAVSMKDYYGLLGVLRSSRFVCHTLDAREVNAEIVRLLSLLKPTIRSRVADLWLQQLDAKRLEKWLDEKAKGNWSDDGPVTLWKEIADLQADKKSSFSEAVKQVADRLAREVEQAKSTQKDYIVFADFRREAMPSWQFARQGLQPWQQKAGDFVVALDGDKVIAKVLQTGLHTHALSAKLNGSLRSKSLTNELTQRKKFISFRVMGKNSSAVRLVNNNCQLNYANYRALTSDDWKWVTFKIPDDRDAYNTYAELMTKFDNPKFPDQLGTLGGDTKNDRIPWEQAAADPRSYFGISLVVLHDRPDPPAADRSYLIETLKKDGISSAEELAKRFTQRLEAALKAWKNNEASDADVRWIDFTRQYGYLNDSASKSELLALDMKEYRRLEAQLKMPKLAPGVAESGRELSQPIFTRGDCTKPGQTVPRGFVEAIMPKSFTSGGSGRLELANQIANAKNPLTARVMVNRIWHHLFGAGIVRTVDDFGHVGDLPSHPELLDYLAHQFVTDGWSVKRLIREIVLTRTFQTDHQPGDGALLADPENRLLQHYPARRMEAEAIRDSLLFASGRLDAKLYGMSVRPFREKEDEYHRLFRGPLDGDGRRSIYIKVMLMEAPAFLESFNIPGGKVATGRRDLTSVPAQALAMLNDPLVRNQADYWAKQLVQRKNESVEQRIESMFLTALGRMPSAGEKTRFAQFADRLADLHHVSRAQLLQSQPIWSDMAHTLYNLQEFIVIP